MKNHFRRLAAALVLLIATATMSAAPASAHLVATGDYSNYCNQVTVDFYGDSNYAPFDHHWYACPGSNVPYFTGVYNHYGWPTCRDWIGQDHNHFDNCITSIWVDFKSAPANLKLCLYVNENYSTGGGGLVIVGDYHTTQLSGSYNDKFSSMKWTTGSC